MKSGNVWQDFEWEVAADGYCWRESRLGPTLVTIADGPEARMIRYRPFSKEHAGLFTTFAGLDQSPDSVLSFANRYGFLGPPVLRNFWQDAPVSVPGSADGNILPSTLTRSITSVGGFCGELLSDEQSDAGLGSWCWVSAIKALATLVSHRTRRADDKWMTASIGLTVNLYLGRTAAPYLDWSNPRRSFHLRLRPQSLLGALWLQAALAITEAKVFRNCPVCERPIEISRSGGARADAKFCSNKCKTRDYRDRKAKARTLADKGLGASQIARRLRTDSSTIRRWLR